MRKRLLFIPCLTVGLLMGSSLTAFAATGWTQESGGWVYYNRDGSKATDELKKSGDNWYYLDSNGDMARSQVIEVDDDYYYVNSSGAMVRNEWREVPNDSPSDGEPDTWWYYFQSNGKAVKKSSSSSTPKFVTLPTATGNAKFTFDEEGHMLSGWIDENGEMLTDDDAWKNGVYYCDGEDSGRQVTGWKYLEAEDDENEDREGNGYWFYFNSNGKKQKETDKKTINGKKYRFNEYGAAQFKWYNNPDVATGSNATPSNATNQYYNEETQCWMSTGWFKTVPSEEVDAEAYHDDEAYWFYADKKGELVTSQIKTINGQRYGFNDKGEMLHGLYKITFEEDGKTISMAEEIETESDIPETSEEGTFVYYFGDSPKEGCIKTGDTTIEIDGEKYQYRFKKSGSDKGAGVDGIEDDRIYIMGKLIKADSDAKYEVFTYNGQDYLINTSGKIVKNKTNVKDADDVYYCTDKKGVVTYQGSEKYKK